MRCSHHLLDRPSQTWCCLNRCVQDPHWNQSLGHRDSGRASLAAKHTWEKGDFCQGLNALMPQTTQHYLLAYVCLCPHCPSWDNGANPHHQLPTPGGLLSEKVKAYGGHLSCATRLQRCSNRASAATEAELSSSGNQTPLGKQIQPKQSSTLWEKLMREDSLIFSMVCTEELFAAF